MVLVIGSAPLEVVKKVLLGLQASDKEVAVCVRGEFVEKFSETELGDGRGSIHSFGSDFRIHWYTFSLLRVIRTLKPTRIIYVTGADVFHSNVDRALRWWRFFLRIPYDICISYNGYEPVLLKSRIDYLRFQYNFEFMY